LLRKQNQLTFLQYVYIYRAFYYYLLTEIPQFYSLLYPERDINFKNLFCIHLKMLILLFQFQKIKKKSVSSINKEAESQLLIYDQNLSLYIWKQMRNLLAEVPILCMGFPTEIMKLFISYTTYFTQCL